jgi:hypothetical protein
MGIEKEWDRAWGYSGGYLEQSLGQYEWDLAINEMTWITRIRYACSGVHDVIGTSRDGYDSDMVMDPHYDLPICFPKNIMAVVKNPTTDHGKCKHSTDVAGKKNIKFT